MSVSIIMPCHNEEGIISKVISDCYNEIISKIEDSEFIIIDDCSCDNTPNILEMLQVKFLKLRVIKNTVNGGHGKSIRLGYEAAQKKWIFQIDSDNQFDIKDFWRLYALRDKYNFILGVRKTRYDPSYRLILTRIIRFVNFVLFGVWLKDANCPFRLIKRDLHDELLMAIDKEALAPNILISLLAKKRRNKIGEVYVTHYKRKTGSSSIMSWRLIKFCMKGFRQLLEFRKVLILNHY